MAKSIGTLIAALVTGVLGFLGAKFAAASTVLAAQAGTFGSIAAMTVFFAVLFATRPISDDMDVRTRLKSLQKDKANSTLDKMRATRSLESAARTTQRVLMMGSDTHLAKFRTALFKAGYYSDRALFLFIVLQASLSLLGPIVGFAAFWLGASTINSVATSVIVTAIGWFGPKIILDSITKSRRGKLFLEFPDALDLIVIYVESGVAFDTALVRVIDTLRKRYPTVASELRLLEYELRYYTDRSQAFRNLAARCDIDVVSRLTAIVEQSEQIGSPIAESLKILAKESRDERFLLAERKAAKLPVIMQVPIVLLILPSLFLLILGPVGIKIVDLFDGLMK